MERLHLKKVRDAECRVWALVAHTEEVNVG
jgi:hypothetical protein